MKIKTVLVIAAFAICLILVILTRQSTSGLFSIHNVDFFEYDTGWNGFKFVNIILSNDKDRLLLDTPDEPGYFESPSVETDFDFNELLLAWNCDIDNSGGLYFILSVSPDNENWHDFAYQQWGDITGDSLELSAVSEKIDGVGRLETDVLKLDKPMKFYRFSSACFADDYGQFSMARISVCYSNTVASIRQYHVNRLPAESISRVALAVPYHSQHSLPDSIAEEGCSQTSVAMVMNYHGRNYSSLELSEYVYDSNNDIYGNWLYNVQAAYQLGMKKTWVGRHNSFEEITAELLDGKPVVISIAFENGELKGAPYTKTSGHLIVVRGFDGESKVIVNDPYGHDVSDGVNLYDIDELTAVWIEHGGAAYHIWPE